MINRNERESFKKQIINQKSFTNKLNNSLNGSPSRQRLTDKEGENQIHESDNNQEIENQIREVDEQLQKSHLTNLEIHKKKIRN
jgi:hypothetical protein